LGSCGITPTVCGSQPFTPAPGANVSWKEAVVLETPLCTDAVQNNFHLLVGILYLDLLWIILLFFAGVALVPNVTLMDLLKIS
jgi:hypothetical protein